MSSPWTTDPRIATRLHPQYPDDLQVLVHDGEPRRTQRGPEACWLRITHAAPRAAAPLMFDPPAPNVVPARYPTNGWVYTGTLLNAPHALTTVREGDALLFVACEGAPHPVMVTAAYLDERAGWRVRPCDACGFEESLDPPTVMARTRFPGAPAGSVVEQFSAKCLCGGMQLWAKA